MGNMKEFPDKICSWEGCNQEDPAAAREPLLTVDPTGDILITLRECSIVG